MVGLASLSTLTLMYSARFLDTYYANKTLSDSVDQHPELYSRLFTDAIAFAHDSVQGENSLSSRYEIKGIIRRAFKTFADGVRFLFHHPRNNALTHLFLRARASLGYQWIRMRLSRLHKRYSKWLHYKKVSLQSISSRDSFSAGGVYADLVLDRADEGASQQGVHGGVVAA